MAEAVGAQLCRTLAQWLINQSVGWKPSIFQSNVKMCLDSQRKVNREGIVLMEMPLITRDHLLT